MIFDASIKRSILRSRGLKNVFLLYSLIMNRMRGVVSKFESNNLSFAYFLFFFDRIIY